MQESPFKRPRTGPYSPPPFSGSDPFLIAFLIKQKEVLLVPIYFSNNSKHQTMLCMCVCVCARACITRRDHEL